MSRYRSIPNASSNFLLLLLAVPIFLTGCGPQSSDSSSVSPSVTNPPPPIAVTSPDSNARTHFRALMDEGRYRDARNIAIMRLGAERNLVAEAEIKDYVQIINDPKSSKEKKQRALIDLSSDYPDEAKPFATVAAKAMRDFKSTSEAQAISVGNKLAAEAKKQGVRIGMSRESVIMTNWGRPERISHTTTAAGETEMWFYRGMNSLYFVNGSLAAINN